MRHVIVIETVDVEAAGKPITSELQRVLTRAIEIGLEEFHGPSFVRTRFNTDSAVDAVLNMYGCSR